jgi:crotonobetaine/carnitine-CoA ligase
MFSIPAMLKAQPVSVLERKHKLRLMYNASHDRAFEERFGVPLLEAYGLIETGITIYSPYGERRWGSCGRIHRDWEAVLVDDNDVPVAAGEAGELLLRPKAPWVMMDGYLNKPEATLRALRNLWFHTGDFLVQDADGYFAFAGRQKERIRRRGENISAWEIERIVYGHPDIELCAAIGHPAEVGDDDVRLALTVKGGKSLSPEQLMDWLNDRMPAFMLPRYIDILDKMPLTPTEKVRKSALLEAGLGPAAWDRVQAGYLVGRKAPEAKS